MALPVMKGDRVGLCMNKSPASFLGVFGVLKAGACLVPLDPAAPAQRLGLLIRDCGISTILTSGPNLETIAAALSTGGPTRDVLLVDDDPAREPPGPVASLPAEVGITQWNEVISYPASPKIDSPCTESDTAYILYTSGSTGAPKGVMISHRNSLSFVEWAAECVGLTPDDRVCCPAPLHFDLSVFDVFASCLAGSTTVVVPQGTTTFPVQITKLIEHERVTVWYSVPSVLTLLTLYGNLQAHDLSHLRTVIFAGEVFPVKFLRNLMEALPNARFMNWYGPTETNVCTYYLVPQLEAGRTDPLPIGIACANTEVFAVDSTGKVVTEEGEEGELQVSGPTVMQGYWGHPEMTEKVLVRNPLKPDDVTWAYKTGDIVSLNKDGSYEFRGRRDGMVKTRGYRVELGEIESVLYGHPDIREAVVLAVPDEIVGNRLLAVVSLQAEGEANREGLLDFCKRFLPNYMIPERVEIRDLLPKTSTGKINRAGLARDIASEGRNHDQ